MTLNLTVHSHEDNWLKEIYGKDPSKHETVKLLDSDIAITYQSTTQDSKGFGVVDAIITLAINIGVGVPAGIIANTIYDKIMEKGKNKLIIKEKKLTIITKDELITYIEKSIEEQ